MTRYLHIFILATSLFSTAVMATEGLDVRDEFYQAKVNGMVSVAEVDAIEATCYSQRQYGLDAYYQCIHEQLMELEVLAEKPDISGVSDREQYEIERACGIDLRMYGQVVYYRCISKQLAKLIEFSGKPDLSGVNDFERSSIELSCGIDKRLWGPANYYSCIRDRISELKLLADKPDLSKFTYEESAEIGRRCGVYQRLYGPARFYQCVQALQLESGAQATETPEAPAVSE
jgi:hypothetical protein